MGRGWGVNVIKSKQQRTISYACVQAKSLQSCLTLTTPWTVAHQAPLSVGISRQDDWRGLPFLPPGDLPHPRIKSTSLASPALAGAFSTTSATSVQFSRSVVSDSASPWTAAHQAFLSIQLPKLAQTHVHRVGDAFQPSQPLLSPFPPAFSLFQHQGLFQ